MKWQKYWETETFRTEKKKFIYNARKSHFWRSGSPNAKHKYLGNILQNHWAYQAYVSVPGRKTATFSWDHHIHKGQDIFRDISVANVWDWVALLGFPGLREMIKVLIFWGPEPVKVPFYFLVFWERGFPTLKAILASTEVIAIIHFTATEI